MAGMDPTAALLANRTDCEYDSQLNFDQLLLGGYYCHVCLPVNNGAMCDAGGECTNVQWRGYICDNEFVVKADSTTGGLVMEDTNGTVVDPATVTLKQGVTYRFSVEGDETFTVSVHTSDMANAPPLTLPGNACGCATNGPLLISIDDSLPTQIYLRSNVANSPSVALAIEPITVSPNGEEATTLSAAAEEARSSQSSAFAAGSLFGAVLLLNLVAILF